MTGTFLSILLYAYLHAFLFGIRQELSGGMLGRRVYISAMLVGNVNLFPAVALQIYISHNILSTLGIVSLFNVSLVVVCRFSAFPFDYWGVTLLF